MPDNSASNKIVGLFTKDWKRLRQQKSRIRGGVEARCLLNRAMLCAEQYAQQAHDTVVTRALDRDEDRNKLHLVFNLIRKAQRRKIGRLWSIANEFRAVPDTIDPKAYDQADVVSDLIRALNAKVKEKQKHWNRLDHLTAYGVCIEHVPWIEASSVEPVPAFDPETDELLWRDSQTEEVLPQSVVEEAIAQGASPERFKVAENLTTVGDVGSILVHPLCFFIDASVPSVLDLAPDQACYIAEIKTHGWIKENFGSEAAQHLKSKSDLSIVQTRVLDKGPSYGNINLRDMIPAIQGEQGPDDPPMGIVLTRYQPAHEDFPSGRRTIMCPDGVVLDDVGLDELKYEEIPIVDFHYGPNSHGFWTEDFITDMIPAQKFLNKRMSQMGESANASIYEVLLLGGDLTKADVPSDYPGHVEGGISEDGSPLVAPLMRQPLPGWFVESIRMVIEYIDAVGGSDLLQNRKFPGQLRGTLSVPMLQEILDSEDGPLFEHLGESLARVHQMRVNRVKGWYEPIRTLHYTGPDMKDETLVFHTSKILRGGVEFNITVDRSTLLPELSAMREARVRERLESPIGVALYTNRRTGRLDASKIAQDLKYRDTMREDRETQYRKIAKQLGSKIWDGAPVDPAVVQSFWDHDAVMDELEATMATMEFIEASPQVVQGFTQLYEACRTFLQQIHDAQAQQIESKMMQGAVAQATQQVAAKTAALTTEAALSQLEAQAHQARLSPIQDQLTEALAAGNQRQQGARRAPTRPPTMPSPTAPKPQRGPTS